MNLVDLCENGPRLRRRNETSSLPTKELRAQRILRVLHEAAEPGRRDVQEPRGSRDRPGQHDG